MTQLEKDVPIPAIREYGDGVVATMSRAEVGESAKFPTASGLNYLRRRFPERVFVQRKLSDGIRIWRAK